MGKDQILEFAIKNPQQIDALIKEHPELRQDLMLIKNDNNSETADAEITPNTSDGKNKKQQKPIKWNEVILKEIAKKRNMALSEKINNILTYLALAIPITVILIFVSYKWILKGKYAILLKEYVLIKWEGWVIVILILLLLKVFDSFRLRKRALNSTQEMANRAGAKGPNVIPTLLSLSSERFVYHSFVSFSVILTFIILASFIIELAIAYLIHKSGYETFLGTYENLIENTIILALFAIFAFRPLAKLAFNMISVYEGEIVRRDEKTSFE